jgi:hypothetical protein
MKRSHFTYDLFTWAVATVFARQNQIQLDGKNGIHSFISINPLWPLLIFLKALFPV